MRLNLKNLLDDSRDFHHLQTASQYPGGRVLLGVIEKLRDKERGEIEDKPMIDIADVRKDVRFKLGMIRMANLILGLPDEAFKHISQLEGRET
jgi:hypothetical protein